MLLVNAMHRVLGMAQIWTSRVASHLSSCSGVRPISSREHAARSSDLEISPDRSLSMALKNCVKELILWPYLKPRACALCVSRYE
jgi:hypothetical protein